MSNLALINGVIARNEHLPYLNKCIHSKNNAPCKQTCLFIAKGKKVETNCFECGQHLLMCSVAAEVGRDDTDLVIPPGVKKIEFCAACFYKGIQF